MSEVVNEVDWAFKNLNLPTITLSKGDGTSASVSYSGHHVISIEAYNSSDFLKALTFFHHWRIDTLL